MKNIRQAIIGAVALSFASAIHTFAIEGLKISVQSSNAVLSWPSTNTETYIVQYRPTLTPDSSWQTLADNLAAANSTNITRFVHSNSVQYAPAGSGGGGGNIALLAPSGMSDASSMMSATATATPAMPMAIPANGSGGAVPLAIYPPGFDLSGFTIFDPVTGESVSGNGYSVSPSLMSRAQISSAQDDEIQPLDASPNGVNSVTNTGFYRVVRDGAHLFGITNGMNLSGVVTIPVEVANGYGTLDALSLTEDEAPVYGATSQTSPISLPLQLTVDTTQMSNGVHQISASARWDDTNGGLWEADSSPVTVNVYNEITFPNWMPRFGELGNSLMLTVQSAHTDADWWIDIYDSQYAYIGTFAGHTYDGNIEGAWNLLGPYNEFHGDDTFHFVVTTEWTSSLAQQQGGASPAATGTASAVAPRLWKATDPWTGPGGWVGVAQHAFDNLIDHDLMYAELGGFVGAAQNVGWQVSPPPYTDGNDNLSPFAINFQNGSEVGDWATFRSALYNPNSRNLVYFGHGGPYGLGYNQANTNVSISAKEIGNVLHTIPDNQTNRHAFRFVFLDGCSTAKGTLPEAFGIIHKPITDVDYYAGASIRPSAFVGWSANKYVSLLFTPYINYAHVNFISHIQTQMLAFGWGLQESIDFAANQPDVYWPFIWTGQFKVFGFTDLHYGQYNN
jgi:hypothetical protein